MIGAGNWSHIVEDLLQMKIVGITPVGGSSSGETIKVKTQKDNYFLKLAPFTRLKAEKEGLDKINVLAGIRTPRIIALEPLQVKGLGLLLMEFISPAGNISSSSKWDSFLTSLKKLHSVKSEYFGLSSDNFIGRLDQPNGKYLSWKEFYIEQRLEDQWKKGVDEGAIPKNLQSDFDRYLGWATEMLDIDDIKPSLLHGDLWSGNIMFDRSGEAVFIDPAIYYGHGEVDLAMMDMFGGFPPYLTESYLEGAIHEGYENRKLIYQLYYQLVHVRLFGGGYLHTVKQIISDASFR